MIGKEEEPSVVRKTLRTAGPHGLIGRATL